MVGKGEDTQLAICPLWSAVEKEEEPDPHCGCDLRRTRNVEEGVTGPHWSSQADQGIHSTKLHTRTNTGPVRHCREGHSVLAAHL